MLDERIAPYVPTEALHRPAGAVVRDGMVTCVSCQRMLPLAKADIVGLGYRCFPCSQKAHVSKLTGGGDAGSHFTANERTALRSSGMAVIWSGIGLVVLGAVLIPALWMRTGVASMMIGVIAIVIGLARRNAAD